jgi:Metallopeptidase family M81
VSPPRIALLAFSIECNRFVPIAHESDFRARTLLGGEAMLANARSPAPMMLGEMPGFVANIDAAGPWEPVPGLLAMAEPNGPVSQEFFDRMMAQWETDPYGWGSERSHLIGTFCVIVGRGRIAPSWDADTSVHRRTWTHRPIVMAGLVPATTPARCRDRWPGQARP